jgi:hypothetical protein
MTSGQKIASVLSAAIAISMMSAGVASADVRNYSANGSSRSVACSNAKFNAERSINVAYGRLQRFGSCDCSENREVSEHSSNRWSCSVDAYYQRR